MSGTCDERGLPIRTFFLRRYKVGRVGYKVERAEGELSDWSRQSLWLLARIWRGQSGRVGPHLAAGTALRNDPYKLLSNVEMTLEIIAPKLLMNSVISC